MINPFISVIYITLLIIVLFVSRQLFVHNYLSRMRPPKCIANGTQVKNVDCARALQTTSVKELDTSIFDNKDVFLVANNPNISSTSTNFLNNYDYSTMVNSDDIRHRNSLVVRFNGFKEHITHCNNRCDIMIHRKMRNGYDGYTTNTYNMRKNVIKIFTQDKYLALNNDYGPQFKIISDYDYMIYIDRFEKQKSVDEYYYYTSGFQTLLYLSKNKKIKNIYLVGYTFHNKTISYWHNAHYEHEYFKKNLSSDDRIKILI